MTATVTEVGPGGDGRVFRATLENGTAAEGGEVMLHISAMALSRYDVNACVDEFERWVNATLGPDYRLDAVLAMGRVGPFTILSSGGAGLYIRAPEPDVGDLAA